MAIMQCLKDDARITELMAGLGVGTEYSGLPCCGVPGVKWKHLRASDRAEGLT